MRFFLGFAKFLPVMALAACTTIPVSSMWALSRIDFSSTRIEELRVAIEIPDSIQPREGGVHMDVVAKQGNKEDKFNFRLAEEQAHFGMKGLLPFPQKGKKIYAYRLKDEDAATLIKLRQKRLSEKKAGEKGNLAVGIAAKDFCRHASLENLDLYVTTFIATSETEGFITLSKDFDLRSDTTVSKSIQDMPLCKN